MVLIFLTLLMAESVSASELSRLLTMRYVFPTPKKVVVGDRAGYDLNGDVLYLPGKEKLSLEAWAEMQSKNKKNGYYFSSTVDPEDGYVASQTRHEYGHLLEYRSNIFKDGNWFEILRKIDPKRDISEYASTDPREAFAEAFSLYTSPLYGVKIKRMPKIVEEYLESLKQKE